MKRQQVFSKIFQSHSALQPWAVFGFDPLRICAYRLRMGMTRKAPGQKAVRINITLPPHLFQAGQDLMRSDYYGSFADMVQGLIRDRLRKPATATAATPET